MRICQVDTTQTTNSLGCFIGSLVVAIVGLRMGTEQVSQKKKGKSLLVHTVAWEVELKDEAKVTGIEEALR